MNWNSTCAAFLLASVSFLSARIGPEPVAPGVIRLGVITDPELTESSGIVASRSFPGVFWTHNDHGQIPKLFAIAREGGTIGKFKVTGATISDWEDISIDDSGNLYIADIGNNNVNRNELQVYRVVEPNPRGSGSVRVGRAWHLKFPHDPKNCEGFFVHNGFGYLVSKERKNQAVDFFRFSLASSGTVTLELLGSLRVGADVSAATISRDGQLLGIVTEKGAYAYRINGNPLSVLRLRGFFTAFDDTTMEGGTFAGNGLLVSSEDGQLFLFNAPQFRAP
jgi:hypothetical protein